MARENVNPEMDLTSPANARSANTGGKVDTGNRVPVNPDMELTKGPAKGEPIADEKQPAVLPGVGNVPTGKKAAGKVTIGMG